MLNNLKKTIFLDIDGTLVDYDYRSNCVQLVPLIKEIQEKGNIFALNSNRPLEDLLQVAQEFGIKDGLLIGENGVFVYKQKEEDLTYILEKGELKDMKEQKEVLEQSIKNFCKQRFGSKFRWFNIDTVNQRKSNYPDISIPNNTLVIFNDKFRKYTMSAHVKKKKEDEKFVNAFEELIEIYDSVKDKIGNNFNLFYSEIFANILLTSKLTNKRKAVEFVSKNIINDSEIIGIGDELGDFEMINGFGKFFAVGNADKEVKVKANFVAEKSFGEGVFEILNNYLI